MNRRVPVLAIVALLLLTVLTYLPALRNGFIWDDDDHLTQNRAVAARDGLRKIWTSPTVARYYPLTLTSFWAQRRFWGLNPMPYHAVNIALHAANAVLVFVLLRKLNVRDAWVAAALWAVHPVNVESVAWVTELKNTQSALFFFLALLCFLQFERQQRSSRYALSLLCFTAAVLSKPSTVVLPLVLLLLAWWQRGRVRRQDFVRAAPFFGLALAMSVLTIIEQRSEVAGPGLDWSLSFTERLILAGKALWFYAGKLVWPAPLMFVYPRWIINADSLLSLAPLAAAVVLGFVLWRYRAHAWSRAALFGLGYSLIALLPVLGFFDIYYFRYSFVADHFQYLAGLGVVALVSAGGAVIVRQRAARSLLAVVALTVLAVMSWRHNGVFRDDETLWRDTMAKNPDAAIAYNNLGALLNTQKRYESAIGYLQEAIRLRPGTSEPHNNLGISLTELGRYAEALSQFQEALRIRPAFANSHYRLGVLYFKMKRFDDAKWHYQFAIRYDPLMPEPYFELGLIWERQGKRAQAATVYREAIRLKPDFAFAHNNLANLLAEEGKLDEAIQHYRRAVAADPKLENAQRNLGLVLRQKGDLDGAIQHLRAALALESDRVDTQLELGRTLLAAGHYAEAIQTFRDGLKAQPQHIAMNNDLAWLLATCPEAKLRDAQQAVQISERLVESTDPKLPEVLDTLAAAYAEAGRFDDAAQTANEALTLAQAHANSNLVEKIESRLRLYERQQPYRLTGP